MACFYDDEKITFLAENITGTSFKELAVMFNSRFNTNKTHRAIERICQRNGLKNGIPSRWGKDKPSPAWACLLRPIAPIGEERIWKTGEVVVKIAQPNIWKRKERVVWEMHNGPIPRMGKIYFADGDKTNFSPDNLIMLTSAEACWLIRKKLLATSPELFKSAALLAKLAIKMRDKKNVHSWRK